MNIKNIIIALLFIGLNTVGGISQDVELEEERAVNGIKLFAKNNTADELEVLITVTYTGFTTDDKSPVSKVLNPSSKSLVFTLTAPAGVSCDYNVSVSYKKAKKAVEKPTTTQGRTTSIQMNTAKINVFTQDGCGRCEYVVKYFKDMNIPFVELNTTIHDPNQELMFEKLKEAGFTGNSVQMPVVWQNGKLDYNIKDLAKWVKTVK